MSGGSGRGKNGANGPSCNNRECNDWALQVKLHRAHARDGEPEFTEYEEAGTKRVRGYEKVSATCFCSPESTENGS